MFYTIYGLLSSVSFFVFLFSFLKNKAWVRKTSTIKRKSDSGCLYECESIFLIQFNVPFKIISAHMRRANQSVGENGRTPRKTTWHTHKQNLACLTCGQRTARTRTRHSDGVSKLILNLIMFVSYMCHKIGISASQEKEKQIPMVAPKEVIRKNEQLLQTVSENTV